MLNSEQIEDEEYPNPCDKCEYYATHLNYMKRHKVAQHVGVRPVLNVQYWWGSTELRCQLTYNKLHTDVMDESDDTFQKLNETEIRQ